MDTETLRGQSKYLSWLLRHGAREAGLPMDAAGWVEIVDVLRVGRLSRPALDEIVRENNKQRLQVDGERIRASQGHSLEGCPVTCEALEASWAEWDDAGSIWHGTRPEAVASIAQQGLLPQGRTHVHLAEATDSTVGKRANVGVLLEVSPERLRAAGLPVFVSPNGVLLVRRVPPSCIVGLQALTRRARSEEASLRRALGLAA